MPFLLPKQQRQSSEGIVMPTHANKFKRTALVSFTHVLQMSPSCPLKLGCEGCKNMNGAKMS